MVVSRAAIPDMLLLANPTVSQLSDEITALEVRGRHDDASHFVARRGARGHYADASHSSRAAARAAVTITLLTSSKQRVPIVIRAIRTLASHDALRCVFFLFVSRQAGGAREPQHMNMDAVFGLRALFSLWIVRGHFKECNLDTTWCVASSRVRAYGTHPAEKCVIPHGATTTRPHDDDKRRDDPLSTVSTRSRAAR